MTFQVGDVMNLEAFEPESFDIVHMHQVLLHLKDAVGAIKSLYHLVKPGGLLTSRDMAYGVIVGGDPILNEIFDRYYKYRLSLGTEPFGGKLNHTWLAKGGFTWDKIESGCAGWEISTAEERKLWAGILSASMKDSDEFAGDEKNTEKIKNAWSEWEKSVDGRFMALDGWVIGRK